ncbi:Mu transposase C-terminal domain-containing protein [Pseudomonas aeruginosa]|uniref:Mu transposase C-terminal domain-containing protein n=1 Tax=Pseudomonas aeruginosa TaxID=287 RepID=UPI0018E38BD2|nr:Mu transposase C-terminal domain-containing protein [Pseudomonas aeruginosa]MBX5700386.1 transposase [Pseudomonas aeruginosa]MDA3168823.1 transposase [Pseudomonas aeruginosa]MDU0680272.1 DDE-type integrase/transposase/recombinase [Pseudomonas aeruginosa]QQD35975.1 transposase [Pseudomonas aeruginosa]UJB87471.1 transposase [Pseudomonas aeruginosa]
MNTNVEQGHRLARDSYQVEIGKFAEFRRKTYKIVEILNFDTVVGTNIDDGRAELLAIGELKSPSQDKDFSFYTHYDLDDIASSAWTEAQKRLAYITPLLQGEQHQKGAVEKRAKEVGASVASLYRWISRYHDGGGIIGLLPGRRGWGKGNSRLSEVQQDVIKNCIDEVYLNDKRYSKKDVCDAVKEACRLRGIRPPSDGAVHARINRIPPNIALRARGYSEEAANNYEARPGRFPADYPLHRVEIDHTRADVIIVDDEHRLPIGRPWVSMAIDDFSRMITGYYLSLDAPSAVSVAMCLAHSIIPKNEWLTLHGVEGEWPVWGKPHVVHTDNGPDFKTQRLIAACSAHNINREFRAVKRPHWGARIERLMGENARMFKYLPGATGSNPKDKGDVNPEKRATMTFEALEKWLVLSIMEYNNKYHSSIYMPPIAKWNSAYFGSKKLPGGLPPRPIDPWSLQLDFMPTENRKVHDYGVEWDAFYYADVLRPWINHHDPDTKKLTKLIFRRDPRDINSIWFYEPIQKRYHRIPIASAEFPGTAVSEYVQAKRAIKKAGAEMVDQEAIRRYLDAKKRIVEEESGATKSARLQQQKQKNNAKNKTPAGVATRTAPGTYASPPPLPLASGSDGNDGWGDEEVEIYGGIV